MKIRKNVAVIAIIICLVALLAISFTPVSNLFVFIPVALMIPFVVSLAKGERKKAAQEGEEKPKKKINWPLFICITLMGLAAIATILVAVFFGWWFFIPLAVFFGLFVWFAKLKNWLKNRPLFICITLVVFATIATILVAIFFGWWFLLPLTVLFGLLAWLTLLKKNWHEAWTWLFVILAVISLILLGVFGIISTAKGNVGNVVDGDMIVNGNVILPTGNVTLGEGDVNLDKGNLNLNEGDANLDKGNVNLNEGHVNLDKGNVNLNEGHVNLDKGNVNLNEGDVNVDKGNVNVGGNVNVTEPPATEPPATEPPATEPPHSHKYTAVETKSNCTDKGYTTYTCSCGHSYKDAYKDALGHSYKTTVVEPTNAAGGYTEYKCERCGHTYKDNFTDKLPVPTEPEVVPAIKCAKTIRYGETLYVNLEGISASDLKVSNKIFVSVEVLANNRVAITLTEDVTGYLTITDTVSRVNVVIDIVEG